MYRTAVRIPFGGKPIPDRDQLYDDARGLLGVISGQQCGALCAGDDERKRAIALALLARQPTISTQVINECSHVLRRKQQIDPAEVARLLEDIVSSEVLPYRSSPP